MRFIILSVVHISCFETEMEFISHILVHLIFSILFCIISCIISSVGIFVFFRLSICALVAKILPDKVVRWCPDGKFLVIFASCIFTELRAACFRPVHILHLH